MKAAIATTFAAALLAASSLAFAADTGSGDNKDGKQDPATTGSVNDNKAGLQTQEDCREGVSGGAPCQEPGTTMDQ